MGRLAAITNSSGHENKIHNTSAAVCRQVCCNHEAGMKQHVFATIPVLELTLMGCRGLLVGWREGCSVMTPACTVINFLILQIWLKQPHCPPEATHVLKARYIVKDGS